jgi:hypothetical protein
VGKLLNDSPQCSATHLTAHPNIGIKPPFVASHNEKGTACRAVPFSTVQMWRLIRLRAGAAPHSSNQRDGWRTPWVHRFEGVCKAVA